MGAVHFSLDKNLIFALKEVLPLDVFVETGTFKGDSIEIVKNIFSEIHSTELSEEYYLYCSNRFKGLSQIRIYNEDSPAFLKTLQKNISKKSVLYWLDAHWCVADGTAGEKSQCPLLEEIKAIKSLNGESVILIDDARLFISPPPKPHEISQWPDINSILFELRKISDRHRIMFLNDTILVYPDSLTEVVRVYGYKNSVDWLAVMHKTRDYDNLRGQFDNLQIQFDGWHEQFDGLQKQFDELLEQLKEKDVKIFSLNDDLKNKNKTIFSLSDDLKDKDKKIFSLSDDLKEKTEFILKLSDDLVQKEKEILSLSESLAILKKRLSTIIWGVLTLSQFHFPGIWEYFYRKKNKIKKGTGVKKEIKKLKYLEPRVGILNQYEPREIYIPQKYFKNVNKSKLLGISVVTPSFNHASFLERTILSVLDQNYPELEYIIQDGGSTDGSREIIEKYRNRLIHAASEKDNGQADAINKGFEHSSGEIMAWINSDDCYLPGAFNYVANYFQKNPDVDVVYGHRILIDENDKEIGRWILPNHDKKVLYYADFIPQETLFWRRRIWEKVGHSINEEFHFALDWALLLRFEYAGAKIVRLPRFMAAFRIHPQQKTSAQISSLGENEMNRLRKKYIGRDVSHSEINKKILFYLAKSECLNKLYMLKLVKY